MNYDEIIQILVKLHNDCPQGSSDFHRMDMVIGKFLRIMKMIYTNMSVEDAVKFLRENRDFDKYLD